MEVDEEKSQDGRGKDNLSHLLAGAGFPNTRSQPPPASPTERPQWDGRPRGASMPEASPGTWEARAPPPAMSARGGRIPDPRSWGFSPPALVSTNQHASSSLDG